MRESFKDGDPIADFPSEDTPGTVGSEEGSPAPQSPTQVPPGLRRDTAFCDVLTVPVVWETPARARRDVRSRPVAVTATAIQRWVVKVQARTRRDAKRRRGDLHDLVAQRLLVLRRSLPAIATSRTYRPALSMPVVAFLSGLALGGLAMWLTPPRMDGVVASAESNTVEAARERGSIVLAGIGAAPRLTTATSGSQPITPSPATTATSAASPRTAPPLQDAVTRRPLEAAPRRPVQRPSVPRQQATALRPATAAGTGYRGSLSVRSRPEGASVFVNGRLAGTTPLVLTREAVGSRAVRVTLSGYAPWTAAAQVVAYRQTTLSADLRSLPTR